MEGPKPDCSGTKIPEQFQYGGGRRTRTFEVVRRLIYSQLPLPLGTLPRSTASELTRRSGGGQAPDDVKTGRRWRAPGWARLWRNRPGKVNQRRPLIRGQEGLKLPLFGTRDTSLR